MQLFFCEQLSPQIRRRSGNGCIGLRSAQRSIILPPECRGHRTASLVSQNHCL